MEPIHKILISLGLLAGLVVPVTYNGCSQSPFSAADTSVASVEHESVQNPGNPNGSNETIEDHDNGIPDMGGNTNSNLPPIPQPAGNGNTPAFMASGHQGSSMYSCDGGLSWKGYREATATRCANGVDCDHTPNANPEAIAYGADGFMISYGWGDPGQVELSNDGENWDVVQTGRTFAGVAYGNGRYFLCSHFNPLFSADGGATWTSGGTINSIPFNQRQAHFIPQNGGIFISLSNSSEVVDVMISDDNGVSFRHPSTLPAGCGEGLLNYSATTIVLLSQNLCLSMDGGENWVALPLPNGMTTDRSQQLLYNGAEFIAYSRGVAYHSADGMNWQQTNLQVNGQPSPDLNLRHPAFHPDTGKYVGFEQGFNGSYEQTQFFYSNDGFNWTRVDKATADVPQAPHPIRGIAVGYLKNCN